MDEHSPQQPINIGIAAVSGDQQTGKTAAQQAKQDTADRLAKALRDNLHRRKAQARARKSTDPASPDADDATMIRSHNPGLTPESKG